MVPQSLRLLSLAALVALATDGLAQDTPQAMRAFERFRELLARLVDNRPPASRHIQALRSIDRVQSAAPAEFPCAAAAAAPWRRSAQRPTSAHRVRPGDVDVIAAMGDSLTVGYGLAATILTQVFIEARGWSFAAGGQGTWREFLTLPNILKEFNPNLTGYAVQDALSHQRASRFNVAEGGAISSDLRLQARNLVKRLRVDPHVDLQNDWKMVTLLIGSNDFCSFLCVEDDMNATVRRHGEDLEYVLDHLQASLPRTIVNLIVTPNLEGLMKSMRFPPRCYVTHLVECPCLFGSMYKARRRQVVETMRLWQLEERRVANSERYRQKEDFIVLLLPSVESGEIPKTGNQYDLNFLSEDCFHLSQKGNAMGANGLWSNLLEPDDQKTNTLPYPVFSRFPCPTEERPFFSTWGNNGGREPSAAGREDGRTKR